MASKDTPKKLYSKTQGEPLVINKTARCRLCNQIRDPGHSKNLFAVKNQKILQEAIFVHGTDLPQDDVLPHLICKPCERRLHNAVEFKKLIIDTQQALLSDVRAKRCIDVSPSVQRPPDKTQPTGNVRRRRSLDFAGEGGQSKTQSASSFQVN